MPDPIFEHPRLVQIYDAFDGERHDLPHYLAIAQELKARSVLDVGCGTGCLAHLLAEHGFAVTGLEPAKASLDLAQAKTPHHTINWILGDSSLLKPLDMDLAVMTGNVAQVFLDDSDWLDTLNHIHTALKPNGHLVFETRNPDQSAWKNWTKDKTYQRLHIEDIGYVEGWCDVQEVANNQVHFIWTYVFEEDGAILTSSSTLRFRTKEEIKASLSATYFTLHDIRDAPDRPDQEFVFIAQAHQ